MPEKFATFCNACGLMVTNPFMPCPECGCVELVMLPLRPGRIGPLAREFARGPRPSDLRFLRTIRVTWEDAPRPIERRSWGRTR